MRWPDHEEWMTEALLDLVARDLIDGLAPLFEPPDTEDPRSGVVFADEWSSQWPRSESFAAVPWLWVGTHTGRVDGFPEDSPARNSPVRVPTGLVVVVDGLSLLQRTDDGEVAFHRYVDWLGVYQQLGVIMAGRTPFGPRTSVGRPPAHRPG